ncbi:uncharacterized protein LOC142210083 [Leptodactylus fuscus]|uniref:uncharacterized protein LOC142210083 n=1 Tax=Leptodactylus fuscus TaxID=238119 RepID=UPI003F4E8C79
MEHRILHLEKQLEALDSFPSGLDLMERSKSGHQGGSSSVEDMWQMMKMKRRLELNEEGVCKAMMVLQDIMLEVNTLKQSQREVQDQIQKVAETAELETRQRLEQSHSAANTEWDKQAIQIELGLLNTQIKELEEKFDVFHETLARRPETKVVQTSRNSQPSDYDISPMSAPIPSTELSQPDEYMMDYSQRTGQEDDPDFTVETPHGMTNILEIGESGQEYEGDLVHAHPGAPLPLNSGINSSMTSLDSSDAPGSPVVTPALPFGATSKELAMLYRRMDALERDKADRTELRILQDNTDDLAMALQDLQDKMSNVNREIRGLSEGPDMLGRLQGATDLTGTSQRSDQRMGETNLSATMQDIEQELKELRKRQRQEEAMEQSATDKPLYLQGHDGELIGNIQKTMARLQEDCEHLTRTTGSLLQDLDQKQRHIDVLYQKVENLDKNKVHREEADKRTMESKVSHTHFGATIEELSRNIQGVMGKVSAQERDWQRLWEKTNVEMQNKLDRMELEPLKNILEQCWRDLRHQLQENPPQYEADEAAGVRK